jgi:transcriptional regulator with XRE-family HTH domain
VLEPGQVLEIRERYSQGETQGSLCRAFGVSIGTIGRIVRGETWNQYQGPRGEQKFNLPPASQEAIDQSLAKVLHDTEVSPEREEELMNRLNEDKAGEALDELMAPERAKKFLE